jgi:hypothetical protein
MVNSDQFFRSVGNRQDLATCGLCNPVVSYLRRRRLGRAASVFFCRHEGRRRRSTASMALPSSSAPWKSAVEHKPCAMDLLPGAFPSNN